jgi:hypothetical protein
VNGTSVGTTTIDQNYTTQGALTIGQALNPFKGYISNARLVKGTAVYTSNFTPPTALLTAITNTSALLNFTNAGIFDNTGFSTFETVGNAQISTSVKKYGTGSISFDKTDDRLVFPKNENFAFGTGDFTIECWMYGNTLAGEPGFLQTSDTAGGLKTSYTTGITLNVFSSSPKISSQVIGTAVNGTTTLTTGTWYHIALTRASGSVRIFLNGVLEAGPTTVSGSIDGQFLCVGGYYNTVYLWNGYIDELRITKGVARYTSNFTPRSRAFSNI